MKTFGAILFTLLLVLPVVSSAPVRADSPPESPITVQYTQEDRGWAKIVAKTAEESLNKLETDFGLPQGPPIIIMIAASDDDFQRRQPGGPVQSWAAGTAWPEQNLIILKSPRYVPHLDLKRVVIHELGHLILERLFGRYPVPQWLNEGLTMHISQDWGLGRQIAMFRALMTDRLIPLEQLSGNFPLDRIDAETAYAESYYFIAYLKDRYGPNSFYNLIRYLGMGISYRHAFLHTTGRTPSQLEMDFFEWLRSRFSVAWVLTSPGMLWPLAALIMIGSVFLKRRSSRKKLEQWEAEALDDSEEDEAVEEDDDNWDDDRTGDVR